ncbi:hypothetical protein KUV74_00195 [Halomonas sp. DP1Y21-3]|uniref:hypothetical protein n=1 Tax=Halomonas sp. DP1Y21-3 TaxID=2859080 RepID=UPI001C943966|nr:hypothetical protein [Halomonas sp. DP1Y21-3]MBY6108815.1 hypothetical protein [Halomonas sp. DP1Y21-3]
MDGTDHSAMTQSWRALQAINAAQRDTVPIADSQGVIEAWCQAHACRETIRRFVKVATTIMMKVVTVPLAPVVQLDLVMVMVMTAPMMPQLSLLHFLRAQRPMGTRLADTVQRQAGQEQQQQDQIAEAMAQPVEHGKPTRLKGESEDTCSTLVESGIGTTSERA